MKAVKMKSKKKTMALARPHLWNIMFMVQNVPRAYIWYFYGPMLSPAEFTAAEKQPKYNAGLLWGLQRIVLLSRILLALDEDTGPLSPHSCLNSSPCIILALKLKQKWALPAHIFPASWPPHHSLLSLIPIDMFSPVRPFKKKKKVKTITPRQKLFSTAPHNKLIKCLTIITLWTW